MSCRARYACFLPEWLTRALSPWAPPHSRSPPSQLHYASKSHTWLKPLSYFQFSSAGVVAAAQLQLVWLTTGCFLCVSGGAPGEDARCGAVLSAPLKESPYLYQMSRGGWPPCQASPGAAMTNVPRLKDYFLFCTLYWLNVVHHALPTALSPSLWCFVFLCSGHIRPVLCGKKLAANQMLSGSSPKPSLDLQLVIPIGS